jgi:hypothetical protein
MKIRKWLLLIAMITSFNSVADLGPGFFKDAKNEEVVKMKELRDVWSSLSLSAHESYWHHRDIHEVQGDNLNFQFQVLINKIQELENRVVELESAANKNSQEKKSPIQP